MIRHGNTVQLRVAWDPAQFAEMRKELPAQREKLRADLDALIREAREIVASCNPLHLMPSLFFKNSLVDPETYSEPEHDGREACVEYAQSLITAVEPWVILPPTDDQIERFDAVVNDILSTCHMYLMSRDWLGNVPEDVAATRFLGITRHMFVRGSSIVEHDTDLIRALYSPHDSELRRCGNPTAEELIDFCTAVTQSFETRLSNLVKFYAKLKRLHQSFVSITTQDPSLELDDAVKAVVTPEIKAELQKENTGLASDPLSLFRLELTQYSDKMIELLSMKPGDNAHFVSFEKSPGWPTNESAIYHKPLVQHDGEVYCPSPVILTRSRQSILESWIRNGSPAYYGKQFATSRGKILEALAISHFVRLLPSAEHFSNLYYRVGDQRFETDGIILFEDRLFVLEMKSAPFAPASMRGAEKSLKKDLEHLVNEPYLQARRTIQYISTADRAVFEDEDGNVVLDLGDRPAFRTTYVVNVTLADVGHVAARLNSARAMGFIVGDQWPWSVFVNDLRVISEIIGSPAEFLLFLDRRLRLNDIGIFSTIDELDYLGWFLRHGLYFEDDDFGDLDRFSMIGYTVPIERYYDHLAGRVSSGEKPRLAISEWFRLLVEKLGQSERKMCHHVGSLLLSLDGAEQRRIEEFVRSHSTSEALKNGPRTLTISIKGGPWIMIAVCGHGQQKHLSSYLRYADVKRLQTGCEEFVVLMVNGFDLNEVHFEFVSGPLLDRQDVALELAAFQKRKVMAYIEQKGVPRPNTACPCGSGKPFRACCGPRVEAWRSQPDGT